MRPLRTSDKVMLTIAGLAIGYVLPFVVEDYRDYQRSRSVEKTEEQSEWCYLKTIQSGESITEGGPGNYNYSLIMTNKGVDVYIKCTQVESWTSQHQT